MPEIPSAGVDLAAAIALVAGITQAIKALVFPESWHYGRAPMILAAILALALALAGALPFGPAADDELVALATTWLAIYTGAVGTHQTVAKIGRLAAGTTNPSGPDELAP